MCFMIIKWRKYQIKKLRGKKWRVGGGAVAAVFQVVHCHVEPSSRKVRVSFGTPWCCFKVNLKLFPWSEITFEFTGVYHTYCLAWELHSWQDSGRETTQKDHCKRANCWSETVAVRGNEGEHGLSLPCLPGCPESGAVLCGRGASTSKGPGCSLSWNLTP